MARARNQSPPRRQLPDVEIPYRGWTIRLVDSGESRQTPGGRAAVYRGFAQFGDPEDAVFVEEGFKSYVVPLVKGYIREKLARWAADWDAAVRRAEAEVAARE